MHVLVAIAYGKGIILTVPYEKMHGSFFTQFIRSHFNIVFGQAGLKRNARQLFVMDNDPSQTSKRAKEALAEIEAELLKCVIFTSCCVNVPRVLTRVVVLICC